MNPLSLEEMAQALEKINVEVTAEATPARSVGQLQWLLALLRGQYWLYQNLHWESQGDAFYGHHLLFQRIYESVQEQVDTLAEKMVGTYGNEAVCSQALLKRVVWWNENWSQVASSFQRGLHSERCAHACIRQTYDLLKANDALSLGMDDFLMSLDSEHETNEYLMRQTIRGLAGARQASDDWTALRKE